MVEVKTEQVERRKRQENALRLLAACFYEPDKALLMQEKLCTHLRECLDAVCPQAIGFVDAMEQAMDGCSDEDLKVAYAKLFVGPFSLAAAPYGSVYIDEGRRVMGDSTMDVISWYEREGLTRSGDCKDLPDHIAVELEFMSYLIAKEIAALEAGDTDTAKAYAAKQRSFASELVCPWVPEFCERIRQATENEFYTALSDCAAAIIGPSLYSRGGD